jgi:hypothetical protein
MLFVILRSKQTQTGGHETDFTAHGCCHRLWRRRRRWLRLHSCAAGAGEAAVSQARRCAAAAVPFGACDGNALARHPRYTAGVRFVRVGLFCRCAGVRGTAHGGECAFYQARRRLCTTPAIACRTCDGHRLACHTGDAVCSESVRVGHLDVQLRTRRPALEAVAEVSPASACRQCRRFHLRAPRGSPSPVRTSQAC